MLLVGPGGEREGGRERGREGERERKRERERERERERARARERADADLQRWAASTSLAATTTQPRRAPSAHSTRRSRLGTGPPPGGRLRTAWGRDHTSGRVAGGVAGGGVSGLASGLPGARPGMVRVTTGGAAQAPVPAGVRLVGVAYARARVITSLCVCVCVLGGARQDEADEAELQKAKRTHPNECVRARARACVVAP